MITSYRAKIWAGCVALSAAMASPAAACSVCFGDPDSNMARSALIGVAFLGAVIVSVLVTIASFAVCWSKRAKHLESEWLTQDADES